MELAFVGLVAKDVVLDVARYPEEDEKTRALGGDDAVVGGNAANAARVAARLVAQSQERKPEKRVRVSIVAMVGSDDFSVGLPASLAPFGVELRPARVESGKLPTSYIIRSKETGSRTIIHVRSGAEEELRADEMIRVLSLFGEEGGASDAAKRRHVHFEGRTVGAVAAAMRALPVSTTVSLELEKKRGAGAGAGADADDERALLRERADLVVFSSQWMRERGFASPTEAVTRLFVEGFRPSNSIVVWVFTLGARGSESFVVRANGVEALTPTPASRAERVVDTVGAGDAFIGGLVVARFVNGVAWEDALAFASRVAARKVEIVGFLV